MKIISNLQLKPFYSKVNNQQLQTNTNFKSKQYIAPAVTVLTGAAAAALAAQIIAKPNLVQAEEVPKDNGTTEEDVFNEEDELKEEQEIDKKYQELVNSITNQKIRESACEHVKKLVDVNAPICIVRNAQRIANERIEDYLRQLEQIEQIEDPKLKKKLYDGIDKIFAQDRGGFIGKVRMIDELIERHTVSAKERFLKYLQENKPDAYKELTKNPEQITNPRFKEILQEFENLDKVDKIVDKCQYAPNSPEAENAYEEYLNGVFISENPKITENIKKICQNINKDFGVKVFLPANLKEAGVALKLVYMELANYKMMAKVTGETLNLPSTLNFSRINNIFFDSTKNYAGRFDSFTNSIAIDGLTIQMVLYALRHELLHANIANVSSVFPENFKPWYYTEDFLEGGIPEKHVSYAFTDRQEFLAVAAEGDMESYNKYFKDKLSMLGMPKFILNMKNPRAAKMAVKDPLDQLIISMNIFDEYKKENSYLFDDEDNDIDDNTDNNDSTDCEDTEKIKENINDMWNLIFGQ